MIIALLFPAAAVFLAGKYRIFNTIGPVLLCYIGGVALGNSGLLSESAAGLQTSISEAAVALSLPLLLFSMDIRSWFKVAGKAILSMLFATISVTAVSVLSFYLLKSRGYSDAHQLAGMAVGLYTGGTPNLAAIKTALHINSGTYIVFHTYDTLIGLFYILFVISIGQRFFNKFLIPFNINGLIKDKKYGADPETMDGYRGIFSKTVFPPLLFSIFLAGAVVGVSIIISGFFSESKGAAVTILAITTLSIMLSFIPGIRNTKKTFQTGMYIIYIFSFTVASMADLRIFTHINYSILFFVSFSVFGSMALHALFSKIFRIDTDTFLVTSVSAICSPPFVPVIAGALKNPYILLSGITTGIIGYAIGNYLGISLAMLLGAMG